MKKISMYYGGELEIDIPNFERIIHSTITLSDNIWLNSNVYPSPSLPIEIQIHIKNVIFELSKKKIITFWEYPDLNEENLKKPPKILENTSDNILIDTTKKSKFSGNFHTTNKVLALEDYNKLYQAINENILEKNRLIPMLDISYEEIDNKNLNPESTSKIIELRNEYWNIGIAKILGANRLMVGNNPSKLWLSSSEYYRYEQIEQPLVKEIFNRFNIPSLSFLKVEDILDLHKKSNLFKHSIKKISDEVLIEFQNTGNVQSKDIINSYDVLLNNLDEIANSLEPKSYFSEVFRNVGYSISALAFPVLGMLSFSDSFLSWLYKKKKFGFLTFIVECRNKTKMN